MAKPTADQVRRRRAHAQGLYGACGTTVADPARFRGVPAEREWTTRL